MAKPSWLLMTGSNADRLDESCFGNATRACPLVSYTGAGHRYKKMLLFVFFLSLQTNNPHSPPSVSYQQDNTQPTTPSSKHLDPSQHFDLRLWVCSKLPLKPRTPHHQPLHSRLAIINMPVPDHWYCGWCGKGPMMIRLYHHCIYCQRAKDNYATYGSSQQNPSPRPSPPRRR